MRLQAIEILLKQAIGLDTAAIGPAAIERAVRARAVACGLAPGAAYLRHLQATPAELQELIEAVVVPETWFYRDPGAYAALAELALRRKAASGKREGDQQAIAPLSRLPPAALPGPLRLLSVPCASGEEPYSMAMTLLDAGLKPEQFRLEAADISSQSLARARQAVYGRHSFRGAPLDFRDRYFQRTEESFQLKPEIQRLVHFRQGNLMQEQFFQSHGPYDFIFTRHLLIYLDPPHQQLLLRRLHEFLTDEGILFVGPAESAIASTEESFTSINLPRAFAFQKTGARSQASGSGGQKEVTSPLPLRPSRLQPPALPVGLPPAARRLAATPAPVLSRIDLARRLADRGQFDEAAGHCQAWLQDHPESAEAFCLLGIIRDAEGQVGAAADCYRKAIYLEPHHVEALTHLALLAELSGDTATATTLRERAHRAQQRHRS